VAVVEAAAAAAAVTIMIIITPCQPPPRDESAEITAAWAFGERPLISFSLRQLQYLTRPTDRLMILYHGQTDRRPLQSALPHGHGRTHDKINFAHVTPLWPISPHPSNYRASVRYYLLRIALLPLLLRSGSALLR